MSKVNQNELDEGSTGWRRGDVDIMLQEYIKHPCLYDCTSRHYKNKLVRMAAFEKIKAALAATRPYISIDSIKKKLENLRTCYQREKRKVQESCRSGTDADDIYVPSLFYYKTFEVIDDDAVNRSSISSSDALSQCSFAIRKEDDVSCRLNDESATGLPVDVILEKNIIVNNMEDETFQLTSPTLLGNSSKACNEESNPGTSQINQQSGKSLDAYLARPNTPVKTSSLKRGSDEMDTILEGIKLFSENLKKKKLQSERDATGQAFDYFAELIRELPQPQQRKLILRIHGFIIEELDRIM